MQVLPSSSTILRTISVSRLPLAVLAAMTFFTTAANSRTSTNKIDTVLQVAVEEKKIPGIVAMVAVADRVTYQGAAGKRESARNIPMTVDSIFRIASMVKPITSVAVMQLVEKGRVKLDEPAATYLPELSRVQVLEEFDPETGRVTLRPPRTPPTIRQLLSHTSGFAYESFDPGLHAYMATVASSNTRPGDGLPPTTLLRFDPGARWEYGISTDWLGRLIEKISGHTLAEYFGEHIFHPLAMNDTFYDVPRDKQARVAVAFKHEPDGSFREVASQPLQPVRVYSGGGGLYSTAGDYLKFERMLLRGGELGGERILKSDTIEEMSRNQIGQLTVVPLPSLLPEIARDPVRLPGSLDKFGLGFAINTKPVEGGRSPGSLAWAGIYNTFFWIDPARRTCAVLLMQTLPFADDLANSVLEQFERAVYAGVRSN